MPEEPSNTNTKAQSVKARLNACKAVPLIRRSRLKRHILNVAAEWQIARVNVPAALIVTLCEDFEKQIATRVLGMLQHCPPPESGQVIANAQ